MADSGPIRQLYGVIIRDKCKTADLPTMQAYQMVGYDFLKDHAGPEAEDLRSALGDLDKAIKEKGG
jgi:hypothetical protein